MKYLSFLKNILFSFSFVRYLINIFIYFLVSFICTAKLIYYFKAISLRFQFIVGGVY